MKTVSVLIGITFVMLTSIFPLDYLLNGRELRFMVFVPLFFVVFLLAGLIGSKLVDIEDKRLK